MMTVTAIMAVAVVQRHAGEDGVDKHRPPMSEAQQAQTLVVNVDG